MDSNVMQKKTKALALAFESKTHEEILSIPQDGEVRAEYLKLVERIGGPKAWAKLMLGAGGLLNLRKKAEKRIMQGHLREQKVLRGPEGSVKKLIKPKVLKGMVDIEIDKLINGREAIDMTGSATTHGDLTVDVHRKELTRKRHGTLDDGYYDGQGESLSYSLYKGLYIGRVQHRSKHGKILGWRDNAHVGAVRRGDDGPFFSGPSVWNQKEGFLTQDTPEHQELLRRLRQEPERLQWLLQGVPGKPKKWAFGYFLRSEGSQSVYYWAWLSTKSSEDLDKRTLGLNKPPISGRLHHPSGEWFCDFVMWTKSKHGEPRTEFWLYKRIYHGLDRVDGGAKLVKSAHMPTDEFQALMDLRLEQGWTLTHPYLPRKVSQ